MNIPKKRELQQTAFDYSSDIEFENFVNLDKKYTAKPYSILMNDTYLTSNIPSHFSNNLLKTI